MPSQFNIDELWEDAWYAEQIGDDELSKVIADAIRQEEPLSQTGLVRGRIANVRASVDESVAATLETAAPAINALAQQDQLPGTSYKFAPRQNPFEAPLDVAEYEKDKTAVREELQPTINTYREDAKVERKRQMYSMPENEIGKFGVELVDAFAIMVPSILAAPVTGGSTVPLALMAIPAFGSGYENARTRMEETGQEVDIGRATFEGLVRSAYEIGPEKLFGVFDKANVSEPIKKYFRGMLAREAGSEAFTESLNMMYDKLQYDEFPEDWTTALGQIARAGLMGVFLGGGIGVAAIPSMREAQGKEAKRVEFLAQLEQDLKDAEAQQEAMRTAGDEFTDDTALKPTEFGGGMPNVTEVSVTGMGTSPDEIMSDVKDIREGSALDYLEKMKAGSEESVESSIEELVGLASRQEADALQQQTQDQDAYDEEQLGLLRDAQRADEEEQLALELPEQTYNIEDLKNELNELEKGDPQYVIGRTRDRVQRLYREAGGGDLFTESPIQAKMFDEIWGRQVEMAHEKYRTAIDERYNLETLDGGAEADLTEAESDARGYAETGRVDRLERNRVVAEEAAAEVDALLPAYLRTGKGQWKLAAIEPEEGRLYAEWESDNLTYGVNWMPGDPSSQVHTVDKDGKRLRTGYGTKGLDEANVPERLRKKFEDYSVATFLTGDEVARGGGRRNVVRGGTAQVPFRGALDPKIGAAKAGLRAVQELEQQQGRYVKATEEQKLKAKQDAIQDAATAQKDMTELVLAQYRKGGGVGTRVEVPPSKKDKGADVRTYMLLQDKRLLQASEAMSARAVQVLPDGTLRGIEIRLNEKGTKYEAVAVSQGMNPFITEEVLGNMDIKVQRGKISAEKRAAHKLSQEQQQAAYEKEATRRKKEAEAVYKLRTGGKASKLSDVEVPQGLSKRIQESDEVVNATVEAVDEPVSEGDAALAEIDNTRAPPKAEPTETKSKGAAAPVAAVEKDERTTPAYNKALMDVLSEIDALRAKLNANPDSALKPGQLSEANLKSMTKAEIDKYVQKLYPWATDWMVVTPETASERAVFGTADRVPIKETGGKAVITPRTNEAMQQASRILYAGAQAGTFKLKDLDRIMPIMANVVEQDIKLAAKNPDLNMQYWENQELTPSVIKQAYLALYDSDFIRANADAQELVDGMSVMDKLVPLDMRRTGQTTRELGHADNPAWLRAKVDTEALAMWTRGGRDGKGRRMGGRMRIEDAINDAVANHQAEIDEVNSAMTAAEHEASTLAKQKESAGIRAQIRAEESATDNVYKQRRAERARSDAGRLKGVDEGVGTAATRADKQARQVEATRTVEAVLRLRETLRVAADRGEYAAMLDQVESVFGKGVRAHVQKSLNAGVDIKTIDAEIRQAAKTAQETAKIAREQGVFLKEYKTAQQERLFLSEKAKKEDAARVKSEAQRKAASDLAPVEAYDDEISFEQAEDDTQGTLDLSKYLSPAEIKAITPTNRVTLEEVQAGQAKVNAQAKKLEAAKKKAAKERVKKANSEKEQALLNLAQGRAFASSVGKIINTDLTAFNNWQTDASLTADVPLNPAPAPVQKKGEKNEDFLKRQEKAYKVEEARQASIRSAAGWRRRGVSGDGVTNTTQNIDATIDTSNRISTRPDAQVGLAEAASWTSDQIVMEAEAYMRNALKSAEKASKATVSAEDGEVLSDTLDLGEDDTANIAAYEARGRAEKLHVKLRTVIRHGWWRGSGLAKKYGQPIIRKMWTPNKGAAQLEQHLVEKAWLSAQAEFKKAGFDVDSNSGSQAVLAYLQGTRSSSVSYAWGVTIPDGATPYLDKIKARIFKLGQSGLALNALDQSNTKAAIESGRPYLRRTINRAKLRTVVRGELTTEIMDVAHDFAQSLNIPTTQKAAEKMSRNRLASVITDFGFYRDQINMWGDGTNKTGLAKVSWYINPKTKKKVDFSEVNETTGEFRTRTGLRASKQDMIDLILSKSPTDLDYQQEVWSMVEAAQREPMRGAGGTRGEGGTRSIQKARKLLKSDYELITGAVKSLARTAGKNTDTRGKLEARIEEYQTMSFGEFSHSIVKEYPELTAPVEDMFYDYKFRQGMRVLLQEVANPSTVIADTVSKLASTVYMSRYLTQVGRTGFKSGWMHKKNDSAGTLVRLAEEGSGLGEASFRDADGIPIRAQEVWVAPEVYKELKTMTGWGREQVGYPLKALYKVSAYSKYGLVVLNPVAHPRNFISTAYIHLIRGGGMDIPSLFRAGKSATRQVQSAVSKNQQIASNSNIDKRTDWLTTMSIKHGILYDGGRAGAIKDLMRHIGQSGQTVEEVMGAMANAQNYAQAGASTLWEKGKNLKDGGQRWADELFRLEDEWVKMAAFETDTKNYLRWHTGTDDLYYTAMDGGTLTAAENKTLEAAMQAGADSTLDRYPTFSRAAPWVQAVSRTPFLGSFPTFAYEMVRTTVNHFKYIAKMASGRTYDGKKVESKSTRAAMAARATLLLGQELAGHAAMAAVGASLAKGAAEMVGQFLDDDDEEKGTAMMAEMLDAAVGRSQNEKEYGGLLPSYLRNTHSFMTNVDPMKGTGVVYNLSYLNPFGAIETSLMEYGEELYEAINADDPRLAQLAITGAMDAFHDVFLGEEVFLGAFEKRITRSRPEAASYSSDNHSKILGDVFENALDELGLGQWPGALAGAAAEVNPAREFERNAVDLSKYMYELGTGKYENVAEGTKDVFISSAAKLTGLKRYEFDYATDMPRKLRGDLALYSDSHNAFISGLIDSDAKNYEDFAKDYRHYTSVRRRAFDYVYDAIDDSIVGMGRSRYEVDTALDEAGLGDTIVGTDRQQFYSGGYQQPTVEEFRAKAVAKSEKDYLLFNVDADRADQLIQWYKQARISNEENVY